MKQHLFSVLVAAGFIGLSAIGCVDDKTMTTDQFGPEDGDEMAAPAEPAAEPEAAKPQPPPGPVTCVTIKRGVLGDVQDTFIPGDYNAGARRNEVGPAEQSPSADPGWSAAIDATPSRRLPPPQPLVNRLRARCADSGGSPAACQCPVSGAGAELRTA